MSALARLKAETASRMASMNRNVKRRALEATMVRHAAVVGTAASLAAMNRMSVPVAIGGVPTKLALALVALVGEGVTRGRTQAALGGVANACMAVYIERSITTKSVVAGEGDF